MYYVDGDSGRGYCVECNNCPNNSRVCDHLEEAVREWNAMNSQKKAKVKYACGECGAEVHLGFSTCPKCGAEIDWKE